jgi:hypothetical protein
MEAASFFKFLQRKSFGKFKKDIADSVLKRHKKSIQQSAEWIYFVPVFKNYNF